jgi:hypothetical protein
MPIDPFGLPPEEAIKWFNAKGYATSFSWLDVWQQQHSQAFTVAKAMQRDILEDIRAAVADAITNGTTLRDFQKNLIPTLYDKGWWGKKEMTDPATGEKKTVTTGTPRRLETIYNTNLRQAHSAGRWQRIERTKATRPYLRYVHRHGKTHHPNDRPQHQKWHNVVLPVGDPAWDHIMPMNGWNCHCKVESLNERDLARYGLSVTQNLELPKVPWVNPRTGDTILVTKGIDPGFDYNPGKATYDPNTGTTKPIPPAGTPQTPPATPTPAAASDPTKTPEHWAEQYRSQYGDAADAVGYGRAMQEQAKDITWEDALNHVEQLKQAGVPGLNIASRSLELMTKHGPEVVGKLYKNSAEDAECARLLVAHSRAIEARDKVSVPRLKSDSSRQKLNAAAKWFEKLTGAPVRVPNMSWRMHNSPSFRAYCIPQRLQAHMGSNSGVGTWVHEWAHAVETSTPSILGATKAFRSAREAGAVARRLSDVTGLRYGSSERTREDKYWNAYVGKVYEGSESSEFLSTFTGYLADGKGAEILAKDPESFYFGLGLLAGR